MINNLDMYEFYIIEKCEEKKLDIWFCSIDSNNDKDRQPDIFINAEKSNGLHVFVDNNSDLVFSQNNKIIATIDLDKVSDTELIQFIDNKLNDYISTTYP